MGGPLREGRTMSSSFRGMSGRGRDVKIAPFSIPSLLAHSPALTLGPSACTRVTLKRPSAQTTVMLSASTATISPSLPAIPFGLVAGVGLASKILIVLSPSFDHAPGAGLHPRI